MKSYRDDIKKIWRECFNDTREYIDMYFDRVYRETDAMTLTVNDQVASSLLLQQYEFKYLDRVVPMGYIAGAATRRSMRGTGCMASLMKMALEKSASRGDMICSLIPAHDWLYFYYDRFGFTTAFFNDRQHFTSLHTFPTEGHYTAVADHYSDQVFDAFHNFEMERQCSVVHSKRDFLNILDDLRFDTNGVFVVTADDNESIASMAWAYRDGNIVVVKDVMGRDSDSRTAALQLLRTSYPDLPFVVMAQPDDKVKRHLYSHAMTRVVNAALCFETVAQSRPSLTLHIKIKDTLLPQNNHTFTISDGRCMVDDTYRGKLDLDVNIDVLTDIIFSSPKIGDIIGFPSQRPHISLMLD
ncbi:MAG: GNAT family N-acetyltransferase [Bacteroides sp.]|nr:GNAT family N-acetyltransferase [Bacteroides sp.]